MTRLAYSYAEAGAQLGVCKDLVRGLVASGELVAFAVGGPESRSLRISHAELERYIARKEETQRQQHQNLTLTTGRTG